MENDEGRESPERLSVEMIMRKSFRDSCKDYIQNCSLAGAKQICDPNIKMCLRFVWTAVFCTSLITVCYFLHIIWTDTLNKPLIVTVESTEYPIQSINFPAVAICNINRISKKALAQLAAEDLKYLSEFGSLEEVQQVLLNLGRLMDYSYNDTLRSNEIYRRIVEKHESDSKQIINIMKKLTPSCAETLLRCGWAGSFMDCNDIFSMRRTANRGYCCTFNYVLYDHWDSGISSSKPHEPTTHDIKRQTIAGFTQGLSVVLDPHLEDYAYPLSSIQGFDILIFDALQYADPSAGRVNHRMSEPNGIEFLEIKSIKQIASREIKRYSPKTRGCLFHDELPDTFQDMYSYSACIVRCRIATIQSLCKCTPFFFATGKDKMQTAICTLDDLKCLNKYKEKLSYLYPHGTVNTEGLETELEDSLDCEECLPDCEITRYTTKAYAMPLHSSQKDKNLKELLLECPIFRHSDHGACKCTEIPDTSFKCKSREGLNAPNISVVSIYFANNDATLIRLDVVNYWYEVLSNVGGFCSIIVGFSIISVIEIIYFFTIRYIQHFIINYRKFH